MFNWKKFALVIGAVGLGIGSFFFPPIAAYAVPGATLLLGWAKEAPKVAPHVATSDTPPAR